MGPCASTIGNVSPYLTGQDLLSVVGVVPSEGTLLTRQSAEEFWRRGRVAFSPCQTTSTIGVIETAGLADWIVEVIPLLLDMTKLPFDWDGQGSGAPSLDIVAGIVRLLHATEIIMFHTPQVIPVPQGGVQMEWFTHSRELEIEFDAFGNAEYLLTDLVSDDSHEGTFTVRDFPQMRRLLMWVGP